jgi:Xaa-Pro aminopeptidase
MVNLTRAKLRQAADLMQKHDLDCWIIQFARETGLRPDPLAYLVGAAITWPSAFLLNRDGRTAAIVGTGDSGQIGGLGLWDEVRGYVASPREDLVALLTSWNPKKIGVTWSESDDTSDGITLGMYRMLESLLEGTPFKDRLVSAGPLAGEVRSRKLPDEIEAIHSAIAFTEQLFQRLEAELRPGVSEIDVQRKVQGWVHEAGFAFSWEERFNPMVDFGPRPGPLGHAPPGDIKLEPGQLIHVDLGILRDGFASDLQRTWYWLKEGETQAPAPVMRAFEATRASIEAGMKALKAGSAGYQVDAESRRTVIEAGFREPGFAFGHHVGRVAHDGAGVLGPRWERYGKSPEVLIQPGNVFAVEMDLEAEGYGVVGLEDEAVVEEDGARYLSNPQRELWLLPRTRR